MNKYFLLFLLSLIVHPIYPQLLKPKKDLFSGKWGFENISTQTWAIQPDLDSAGYFENGLAPVYKNSRAGFVNLNGELTIPFIYENVRRFYRPITAVKKDGRWGYINVLGETIIPFQYEDADIFCENRAPVKLAGKWGFIDPKGALIISNAYDEYWLANDGYIKIGLDKKWGVADTNGVILIQPMFEQVRIPKEGIASVQSNGKWGCYDMTKDSLTVACKYDEMSQFSEGMCMVCIGKSYAYYKCGYIDYKGEEVISLKYDLSSDFSCGVAKVNLNGKVGYINKQGKLITSKWFKLGYSFVDSVGVVQDSIGKLFDRTLYGYGIINLKGEWIKKPVFQDVNPYYFGVMAVKENNLWGFVDKTGRYTIPPIYSQVLKDFNSAGIAQVKLINDSGESILFIDRYGNHIETLSITGDLTKGNHAGYDKVEKYKITNPYYFNSMIVFIAQKDNHYYLFNALNQPIISTSFDSYEFDLDKKTLVCLKNDRPGECFRPLSESSGEWIKYDDSKNIVYEKNPFNLEYTGNHGYFTGDYYQKKIEEYLRQYNRSSVSKKEKTGCNSCSVCHGFGTQVSVGTETCNECGGSGRGQYSKSVIDGYDKRYTYLSSNPCWKCNGRGAVQGNFIHNSCEHCNGTGCEN